MTEFPAAARVALADSQLRRNLRRATHTIREKRAVAVAELEDWQQLREAGSRIKARTIRHLDVHLEALERSVCEAGGVVHWAKDGPAANDTVTALVKATHASEVVKV